MGSEFILTSDVLTTYSGRTRIRERAQINAKTARGRASRQRLIDAARDELIERHGQLEVESVANRAKSSIGLIYRHFGNRAGLIGAVVDDFYTRYRNEALEVNPAPGAPFGVREKRRTELTVGFHYRDKLARVILSNLHLDKEVVQEEMAHLEEMIELAAAVMQLGIRRGELAADRNPALMAAMIIGGMRHVIATSIAIGAPEDEAVRQLWKFIAGVMGIDPAIAEA